MDEAKKAVRNVLHLPGEQADDLIVGKHGACPDSYLGVDSRFSGLDMKTQPGSQASSVPQIFRSVIAISRLKPVMDCRSGVYIRE